MNNALKSKISPNNEQVEILTTDRALLDYNLPIGQIRKHCKKKTEITVLSTEFAILLQLSALHCDRTLIYIQRHKKIC